MTKLALSIACTYLILLTFCNCAAASDIDKLLKLPEKQIDIGIAALTFAKEVYPDLDIKKYSAKIDKLAKEAKAFTGGSTDPVYRIGALNTYLYKTWKMKYDFYDPQARKPENRYINGLLDTHKGSCITMPMLYMAVAQRMGYPVYPVTTPDHFFLRYVDPRLKQQNIEATGGGGYSPNHTLIKDLEVSELGIKSGAYMRTLTYREYLADLLSLNGAYWAEKGDLLKGIDYVEKAAKINPKDANLYDMIGRMYMNASKNAQNTDPITAEIYRDEANDNFMKADSLGFTRPSQEKYKEVLRKKIAKEKAMNAAKGGEK